MLNRIIAVLMMLLLLLVPSLTAAQDPKSGGDESKIFSERLQGPEPEEIESKLIQQQRSTALEGPIDPATYILGPMDRLVLIIGGPEAVDISLRVLPEGVVVLPNIGPFQAAGLTLADFKEKTKNALSRYYRNVDIDCHLSLPRTFNVFVLGEVNSPGPVELHAPFRLSEALLGAGDRTGRGTIREIEIWQSGRLVRTVDLYTFLRFGDFENNPSLREGQSVVVPPKRSVAKVIGEVWKKGEFEIRPGETVEDLLHLAGGITTFGSDQQLIIERIVSGDSTYTIQFPIERAGQYEVHNRDVLIVPDIFSFPQSRFVYVSGGGGRNGRFLLQEGETLRDFLPRLWRFTQDDASSDMVLERKTDYGKAEFIQFNPDKVMLGEAAGDLVLRPGDIITIPPTEESVFVTGEVVAPGPIEFRADLRAEHYISLAGGLTDKGGYGSLSIFSKDGTKRQGEGMSEVYRGETIVVKQRKTVKLRSFIIGMGSLSGLVLAIIALTQVNK